MDGIYKNVHVKFLKDVTKAIKRVTTVLEDDVVGDDVTVTNCKVHVEKIELNEEMQSDIENWLHDFSDVVCTEPGLTDWVELAINTGDAAPVAQRPYNTLVALREAVSREIDWLVQKGCVRRFQSEWSSPIITVKKPDALHRLQEAKQFYHSSPFLQAYH